MNEQKGLSPDQRTGQRHLSRRTVLRTAAHAAWVVPAIQVVGLAPAFAAASDVLLLTPASSGQWTNNRKSMTASVPVKNNSTTDPTVALQLTVTFPNLYVGSSGTLTISAVTGGWAASAVTYPVTGGTRTARVVFTAATQLVTGASSTLGFTATQTEKLKKADVQGAGDTIAVQATATGFIGASTTFNPAA